MKKYELTVEATNFEGHQVFACEAENEEEAKKKFKSGECEIIECNIEVLGLGGIQEICESKDIKSRLPNDLLAVARNDLENFKQVVKVVSDGMEELAKMIPHIVGKHDPHRFEKLLAKARGEQCD